MEQDFKLPEYLSLQGTLPKTGEGGFSDLNCMSPRSIIVLLVTFLVCGFLVGFSFLAFYISYF